MRRGNGLFGGPLTGSRWISPANHSRPHVDKHVAGGSVASLRARRQRRPLYGISALVFATVQSVRNGLLASFPWAITMEIDMLFRKAGGSVIWRWCWNCSDSAPGAGPATSQ